MQGVVALEQGIHDFTPKSVLVRGEGVEVQAFRADADHDLRADLRGRRRERQGAPDLPEGRLRHKLARSNL